MRKLIFGASLLWFGLAGLTLAQASEICFEPVKTESGLVRGFKSEDTETCVWLGIPYAKPPVGQLRWRAPEPASSWEGVREANEWGPKCMQESTVFRTESRDKSDKMSEDCLYLNIWRPAHSGKFPVMVWIHGGGYTMGSGKYPAGRLAEFGDLIVVTINYRLNTFGFFANPALREEDPNRSTGNYGSLDQAFALKWVHNNIANFGGDPNNVTIFGESAGGWSVCTMLATPLTRGLFQRAILQSGGCEAVETLERGYEKGKRIAEKLGCKFDDLACLRSVPAEKLVRGGVGDILKEGFSFLNHIDGWLLSDSALAMIRAGNFNRVPLMAGSTKEEVNLLVIIRPRLNNALPSQYQSRMQRNLNLSQEEAQKAVQTYPLSKYENKPKKAFGYILTDISLACPTYLGLDSVSEKGILTYYYRFDYDDMKGGKFLHAFHSSEIPFVFNSLDQKPFYKTFYDEKNLSSAQQLSKVIQTYWTNFAKTSNPNGPGVPEWREYTRENQVVQVLDLEIRSEQTDMSGRCAVWDGYNKNRTPIFETLARKEKRKNK